MLVVEHLHKAFGDIVLFQDFSFSLEAGESISFMAPSGKGKTSLLHMILGLEQADAGRIWTDKKTFSVVFQEDRLVEDASVYTNIALVKARADKGKIKEIAEHLGLREMLYKRAALLSGGQKKRLSLARALYYDGDIFVLDEALKGLDREMKTGVIPYIREYMRGKHCLFVSHDEEECRQMGFPVLHL